MSAVAVRVSVEDPKVALPNMAAKAPTGVMNEKT
jgi:hypothetical protein